MGGIWSQPPMSRQTKVITFEGGHNVGAPSVSIGDNQSSYEEGWSIDESYPSLHTRVGQTAYGSEGSGAIHLLHAYNGQYLLRAAGTTIQRYDPEDSQWKNIGTGLSQADWTATNFEVDGKPATLFTNGTDPVKYWDGTTFANLSSDAPRGKYITTDTIRVWIAKDDILHYSAFLDGQDWTTPKNSGSVQYFTPNGGDITGMVRYMDRVVVFKQNAMAELHGTNYYEFRLMDVSLDIGCTNHKTIQEVQGRLMWLGLGPEVYSYGGARPQAIGGPIKEYLTRINRDQISKCFAGTDGERYYLGLPLDDSSEPNILLTFSPSKGIWRVFNRGVTYRRSYQFNDQWFLGNHTGTVYLMGGTKDGTQEIISTYITKPFDGGLPQAEKEYYEAHLQGYIPEDSSVDIFMSLDERGDNFRLLAQILGESSDSRSSRIYIPMDTVPLCHWARFKIVAYGEVWLYQMEVSYDIHPIQS